MHLFVIGLKDTCEVSSDQVANQTLTDARLCTTCTLSARELVRREIRFSCTRSFPFAATTPFRFHLYPPQTSSHGLYQTLRSSCSESKLVCAGKKFDKFQIGSFCDSVATSTFSLSPSPAHSNALETSNRWNRTTTGRRTSGTTEE